MANISVGCLVVLLEENIPPQTLMGTPVVDIQKNEEEDIEKAQRDLKRYPHIITPDGKHIAIH